MAGSISATTAAIISAAVGAAGVGTSIYEGVQSSNQASAAQKEQQQALLQQQQAQARQASLTKQEAVLGQQGQAQAQTGGSLTGAGTTAITDLLAGYPGFQGGTTGPSTSGSPPNIASILAALGSGTNGGTGLNFSSPSSSSISGGNWPTSSAAQQQGHFELSTPVIG